MESGYLFLTFLYVQDDALLHARLIFDVVFGNIFIFELEMENGKV